MRKLDLNLNNEKGMTLLQQFIPLYTIIYRRVFRKVEGSIHPDFRNLKG